MPIEKHLCQCHRHMDGNDIVMLRLVAAAAPCLLGVQTWSIASVMPQAGCCLHDAATQMNLELPRCMTGWVWEAVRRVEAKRLFLQHR